MGKKLISLYLIAILASAAAYADDACAPGRSVIEKILGGGGGSAPSSKGGGLGGGMPGNADITGRVWDGAIVVALPETGLHGKVFEDANRDGLAGEGERGIPNVKVVTDTQQHTFTNKNGDFRFTSLEPGLRVIHIDEKSLPNTGFTTPQSLKVRVDENVSARVSFGIAKAGAAGETKPVHFTVN